MADTLISAGYLPSAAAAAAAAVADADDAGAGSKTSSMTGGGEAAGEGGRGSRLGDVVETDCVVLNLVWGGSSTVTVIHTVTGQNSSVS
jgi:hypothetical protein